MTCALEKRKTREGPEGLCSNEDSTVCNSPWSSERGGGGGSFAGFGGSLRASSAHGDGGDGRSRARSGTAPDSETLPEQAIKDALLSSGRGRTPPHGKSRNGSGSNRESNWRSYSPPSSSVSLQNRGGSEGGAAAPATPVADGGTASYGKPPPSPCGVFDAADRSAAAESGKLGDAVRSSGGYLPPRHPLTSLQLSPASHTGAAGSESGEASEGGAGGRNGDAEDRRESTGDAIGPDGAETEETPTLDAAPDRPDLKGRGAARTAAKGPARSSPSDTRKAVGREEEEEGPAPTEEGGGGAGARKGLLSGLADWLMPGMEARRRPPVRTELIMDVYPTAGGAAAAQSPEEKRRRPVVTRSAPATPRGRRRQSAVLRDGGWFYNGDSDYSTDDEIEANYDSEDEGFWVDAGTTEPESAKGGEGDENSILNRLKQLFTLN